MLAKVVILAASLAIVNLGQLAWGQTAEPTAVTGTVAYLQRSALPPDAVVNVQLQDVSLQDAPAKIVAEVKIPTAGKQVPIPFRLEYAAADINLTHRYAVRATITGDGEMKFTSNTSYPVITRGAPAEVEILVQPVKAVTRPQASANSLSITPTQTVTFVGNLPCTDCSGARFTLTLFPEGIFRSRLTRRRTASGKDESVFDLGHWTIERNGTRLVLRGGKEAPELFAVINKNTLHQLNNEGNEIASQRGYVLERAPEVDAVRETFRMSGEFIFLADAGLVTECVTRMSFPVAQEKDYIAMERAYASSGVAGGDPLLVTFDGHFATRLRTEGAGNSEAVFVDKFDRAWPKKQCSTRPPAAASNPTDKWLGQWNGPEGTFLILSRNGDKYAVKIQSLDGPATYEGVPAGNQINFTRDGKTESIVAGSGQKTGMKWLLDKKNCLIIKTGEGFCRD
jgi:uncharacterized lipoprotein YbaY